jgi:transposase-like protein
MNLWSLTMKKRIRHGDPQRQRYWEEMVRRCREGSKSVRAFCRAEGLRESAFYFWRRELTRRSQLDAGQDSQYQKPALRSSKRVPPPSKRLPSRRVSEPSFLPVHLAEQCVTEMGRGVDILLWQGGTPAQRIAVRVQAGFDRQTLVDVLAVLEGRPC